MKNEFESSFLLIPEPARNLFTDKVLQKASQMAAKYQAETDNKVLYSALLEIRGLLFHIERCAVNGKDSNIKLMLGVLARRVKMISANISRFRNTPPKFTLTSRERLIIKEIDEVCKKINSYARQPILLNEITPLLIAAVHESDENG